MFDDIVKERICKVVEIVVDRNTHKFFPVDEEIEMDWGKLGENPFADARYAMAEYFNMDEDLRHSYQCNIAMFLYDRCNIQNKEKRDQLAKDLMKLIWEC